MKVVKPILLALCALLLFGGAFVGFAVLRGSAPHEVPVLGRLFPAPPEPPHDEEPDEQAPPGVVSPLEGQPSARPPRVAGLGLLDAFRIDAPVGADELQRLAGELKRKNEEADRRLSELDEREARLTERALLLDEQLAGLRELRGGLEAWDLELAEREAVLEQDVAQREQGAAESWQRMAKLFEKGEAETLARKLEAYTPAEAARILRHLKPDRARTLLEGLRGESWKLYWDAYREAPAPQEP